MKQGQTIAPLLLAGALLTGPTNASPALPVTDQATATNLALSGGFFSADPALLSRPAQLTELRFDRRGPTYNLSVLAETREYREKALPADGARKTDVSLLAETAAGFLALGSRFIPGPHSDFLRDRTFFSGLPGVPSPRRLRTAFFQPLPGAFLPGVFYVEGWQSPGWFLRAPDDSMFAAWHAASRTGALALDRSWGGKERQSEIRTDLTVEKQNVEGAFFLHSVPDSVDNALFRMSALRRAYWDTLDEVHRKGKSGSAAAMGGPSSWLLFEAAGEDRGAHGGRTAGAEMRLPAGAVPGQFIIRTRWTRETRLGTESGGPLYERASAGLGWLVGSESESFVRIFVESERHGVHKGELIAGLRMKGIKGEI
ncbi:MAG: hypothetical protein HY042_11640, partial [Spirochaetia bacterium]|nr:hypothetical protein [Spirochaetia bacterium]